MPEKFKGKKVLVTGGSSGIGRAIAKSFASEGADVAITYKDNEDGAQAVVEEIRKTGRQAKYIRANFAQVTAMDSATTQLIDETQRQLNGLDILINNAGTLFRRSFLKVSEEEYDTVMNTNVKSVWFLTKAFAQYALETNIHAACVVNISSISDRLGSPTLSLYETSKGAVSRLTAGAALSLADYRIRVNAVCPGLVATNLNADMRHHHPEEWQERTDKIPLGLGSPEDVANAVLFLASEEAKWITGQTYIVDGGQTGTVYQRASQDLR